MRSAWGRLPVRHRGAWGRVSSSPWHPGRRFGRSAGMPVPVISEQDFEQQVLMSELPVVVEFFRRESNMSKTVAPEVESAALDLEGKATFVKVDVDRSPRIAAAL